MAVMQLMYISRATEPFTEQQLQALVEQANNNNRHHDITGSLVYNGGVFLQVLEGGREEVMSLYNHIKEDPRHHKIKTIYFEPAKNRLFSKWFMRLAKLETTESKDLSSIKEILDAADDEGKVNGISVTTTVLKEFANL